MYIFQCHPRHVTRFGWVIPQLLFSLKLKHSPVLNPLTVRDLHTQTVMYFRDTYFPGCFQVLLIYLRSQNATDNKSWKAKLRVKKLVAGTNYFQLPEWTVSTLQRILRTLYVWSLRATWKSLAGFRFQFLRYIKAHQNTFKENKSSNECLQIFSMAYL